ncbi:MAG: cytochrome P450 [Solirubrobacterales bacterium]
MSPTPLDQLDLPEFPMPGPEIRGEAWHEMMDGIIEESAEGDVWLARNPIATLVADREAGEFFLRSRSARFPGEYLYEAFGITEGPLHEQIRHNLLNTEGDSHRRLRGLVNPSLTPKAVEKYRPAIREFLTELWDRLDGATEFDFVEAIAKPLPALTIARVMGAPPEDAPKLWDWSNWIQQQFDPVALADPGVLETIQGKVVEFHDWIRPMVAAKRGDPGDDMVTELIAAEEEGEKLTDVELENLVLNVLVGGVDTTQSQLSHIVRLLALHPDQWQALRADPETLVPRAVEEGIRYEPITPFTARMLTEEVEYRDVVFPEGTPLIICAYTANRDPAVFPDPGEFDITKDPAGTRTLTFGAGIHYCAGTNLAKLELNEALTFLADRVDSFEIASEPLYASPVGIYGIDSLELRITPAPVPA